METCYLNPTIPDINSTSFEPSVNIDFTSEIDIWMLDNSAEIFMDNRRPNAPRRRSHFATIDPSGKDHKSIEFHCPSNSFTIFEFSCSRRKPNCLMDFWQKRGDLQNGRYVILHLRKLADVQCSRSIYDTTRLERWSLMWLSSGGAPCVPMKCDR